MKTGDMLLIGGVVLIGGIIVISMLAGKTCAAKPGLDEITCGINTLLTGGAPPALTPGDEVEQAAMYGHYY